MLIFCMKMGNKMYFTINFDLFSGGLNSLCTSLLRSCTRILHCVLFFDENEVRMLFSYHTWKTGLISWKIDDLRGLKSGRNLYYLLCLFRLLCCVGGIFSFVTHSSYGGMHLNLGTMESETGANLCFGFGTGIKDTALRPVLLIRR